MFTYCIANAQTGHGIAFVQGDDEDAVRTLAVKIGDALGAPANAGITHPVEDPAYRGEALANGVTLFKTATDDEVAAVKQAAA